MAAMPNHLVIVNPTSGGGRPRNFTKKLGKKLAAAGLTCELVETVGPGDATNLAREAAYKRDVVVAVGGDGTAHEVASGLGQARDARHGAERPRAALGIVPAGTGNDLARTFGITRDTDQALYVLAAGKRRTIDLFRAAGEYGVNNLAVGYGAVIVHDMKRRSPLNRFLLRGTLAYTAAALKRIFFNPPERYVEVDGGREAFRGRFFEIHVGNGAYCGGGVSFTPRADPSDGLLELTIMEVMPKRTMLALYPSIMTRSLTERPFVTMRSAKRIVIVADHPFAAHLDGEARTYRPDDTGVAHVEIEVVEGAIDVIAS